MLPPFTFSFSKIFSKEEGAKEKHHFDEPYPSTEDFEPQSNVSGDLTMMRLSDAIHVELKNVKLKLAFTCVRCLKPFSLALTIPSAEKEFLFREPEEISERTARARTSGSRGSREVSSIIEDLHDLYFVNMKFHTLSIAELLRQEILLHFPLKPVCSSSCKGLCDQCGKDFNEGPCDCRPVKFTSKISL